MMPFAAAAMVMTTTAAATVMTTTPYLVQGCLPCVDLFAKLEAGADGRLSQAIDMQQRGEPKSGTTVMGSWATLALRGTCDFLGAMYGSETCSITESGALTQLEFIPKLSRAASTCSCDSIDRWEFSAHEHNSRGT